MFRLKIIIKRICLKIKDQNFIRGISTLIGASCINFLIGAIFSLCTLSVYEISYIKGKGGSIEIEHLTFYYPVEILFQCFSAFFSGIIYKQFGLHKTNLIGVSILCLGYFLMYLSSNFKMDLSSMIVGGIGTGILFYPSTTNAYEWFKGHNGIIIGIMETMISLGSFFFSLIGEKIINKNNVPSHNYDNLYDFEIGKNFKFYLIIQMISLISGFFLSFILMTDKKIYYNENISELISKNEYIRIKNKEHENEKDDSPDESDPKDISIKGPIYEFKKEKGIKRLLKEIELQKEKKGGYIPIKKYINEKLIKFILNKDIDKK